MSSSTRNRNVSSGSAAADDADRLEAQWNEYMSVPFWRFFKLSEAEREVFVSCEFEGLRPAELATYTRWEASTIRTLHSRAKEKVTR